VVRPVDGPDSVRSIVNVACSRRRCVPEVRPLGVRTSRWVPLRDEVDVVSAPSGGDRPGCSFLAARVGVRTGGHPRECIQSREARGAGVRVLW